MTAIRFALAAIALSISVPTAAPAFADKDPVYTGRFSNLALQGYDPVAYFTVGAPTKGSSDFQTTYQGAEFRFISQENLELFIVDPEAYAPQYGGYCAWAVAEGKTAKGDARHWSIVDGKLYLNFNAKIQTRWEGDIPGYIEAGDGNWPTVLE